MLARTFVALLPQHTGSQLKSDAINTAPGQKESKASSLRPILLYCIYHLAISLFIRICCNTTRLNK